MFFFVVSVYCNKDFVTLFCVVLASAIVLADEQGAIYRVHLCEYCDVIVENS
jgi:hypothetical protein